MSLREYLYRDALKRLGVEVDPNLYVCNKQSSPDCIIMSDKQFFVGKQCKICRKYDDKIMYQNKKTQIIQRSKDRYNNNKDKIKEQMRKRYYNKKVNTCCGDANCIKCKTINTITNAPTRDFVTPEVKIDDELHQKFLKEKLNI